MQLDPITRAVLDAMQEGVLIIDAQERIVYGNRAYVAFLEKEAGVDHQVILVIHLLIRIKAMENMTY